MLELDKSSFKDVTEGEMPALIDFWAPWCMPCKVFSPVLEELSGELEGRAVFGKVNIDEHEELAREYGIVSIPTVVLFKGGKVLDQMVGVRPRQDVLAALEKHL